MDGSPGSLDPIVAQTRSAYQDPAAAGEIPPALADAERLVAQDPTARFVDGYNADGTPRLVSAADALAEIHAERAQAMKEADAYEAAISCHIRNGGSNAA